MHTDIQTIQTHMRTHIHADAYVHTYIHTCMHACINTYIHTCTCILNYIHTYVRTAIHTYIRTVRHTKNIQTDRRTAGLTDGRTDRQIVRSSDRHTHTHGIDATPFDAHSSTENQNLNAYSECLQALDLNWPCLRIYLQAFLFRQAQEDELATCLKAGEIGFLPRNWGISGG